MIIPFSEIPLTDEQLPPADASWKEILEETNWELLRCQKACMQDIRDMLWEKQKRESYPPLADWIDAIDGLLNFLDTIQDAAANEIGEEIVFDLRCECGEKLKAFLIPDSTGKGFSETFGCPKCDG